MDERKGQQQQRQRKQKQEMEEHESSILASIGSSLTNQSTYEAQVLHDATVNNALLQNNAPQLTGIGFPNLDSLLCNTTATATTSANNNNNIAHMVTIFNKISNQLDDIESSTSSSAILENTKTNILRMKKQILLSYFAKFTNLQKEDIGFDPNYETQMELRRKDRLVKSAYANANTNTNHLESSWDSKKSKNKQDCLPTHNMMKNQKVMDTQRLEDIKQNNIYYDHEHDNNNDDIEIISKSKNASFGKQALESQQKSRLRSKQKIMNMKRKLVQDNGEEWIDPEILYQKRLERMNRRNERKRNRGSLGIINTDEGLDNTTKDVDNQNLDLDRKKLRRKIGGYKKSPIKHSMNVKQKRRKRNVEEADNIHDINDINDTNDTNESNERKETNTLLHDENIKTVSCPICNNSCIPVPSEFQNDIDAFLSQHMHNCTNNGVDGSATTLRSSSRRSNLRRTKQINYKEDHYEEDGFEDEMNNDEMNHDTFIVEKSTNGDTRHKSLKSNYVNDSDIGDEEDESDTEEDTGNDISMSSTAASEVENLPPTAIDDFDEDDYEDRVDHWIAHGIGNMRQMTEQDKEEAKPGAVTFRGGLHIPAWVNDKLFGYQRTAIRWMWELHLQGAGGIVGDEMGLGEYRLHSFLPLAQNE